MNSIRSRLRNPAGRPCGPISPYGNRTGAVQAIAICLAFTIACVGALVRPGFTAEPNAADRPIKIVALGDSLTAGYGLPADATFPVKLERALEARGLAVAIVNAGVSGDTASDGLARLDWSVPVGTEAVILELGANDALRGIDPEVTLEAIETILRRLAERGIAVLLAGMRAPPNLGAAYTTAFDAIYPSLASRFGTGLYPFFLDGVATNRALNQDDGLHPNAAGVDVIVARIIPKVEELIAKARSARHE